MFSKKGHQLKYAGNDSNHTPSNLRAIPSGVMNRLAKLTSQKPSIHYEGVEKYTPTTRTLSARQASHPLISQQWDIYGVIMMRSWILKTNKNLTSIKRKTEMSTFVLPTHVIFYVYSQGDQQAKKVF